MEGDYRHIPLSGGDGAGSFIIGTLINWLDVKLNPPPISSIVMSPLR